MKRLLLLWSGFILLGAAPAALDPAARLSHEDDASEYWDLTASFESGHRLMVRFLITNQGPGEHTAVAVGHLIFPDGRIQPFRNGRRKGRWEIDAEGLRLRIGSSILDLHGPVQHFEVDNNKRGVKIHLALHPQGASSPATDASRPYRVDFLELSAAAEGTIWVSGMSAPQAVSGSASLSHTVADQRESDLLLRRFDFVSPEEGKTLRLTELRAPDGARRGRLAIQEDGKILYESEDFDVSLRGESDALERGYPLPASLLFHGSAVNGQIELGRILLQHDPSADLPQPFRYLLSFSSRPRRVWTEASFDVKLNANSGHAAMQIRGAGIASVTYLNPLR